MSNPEFLHDLNVDYIKSQIESGIPERIKKALQDLCKLYRDGYRIRPPKIVAIEQSIVGALYTQGKDAKVRRWGLNALAHFGKEARCMEAILRTLDKYSSDPQTTASAIAAIYKMSQHPDKVLSDRKLDPTMVSLAALQHVEPKKISFKGLPLNVEKASIDELMLALIVVGLNKSPPNMLNPRHSNSAMVKALGTHHENIVSQYSAWAVSENPTLKITDLGIKLDDLENQPPNVRGWIFHALATSPTEARKRLDLIRVGIEDENSDARLGLARGLSGTFFDGLEPLVMDWYTSEEDLDTSQYVLDHIARHSERCPNYEAMALEVYEKEPRQSSLRMRLNGVTAGTAMFAKFQAIEYNGTGDLFRGVPSVTNNYNIQGNVQGGAVSIGGDAKNQGATSFHYDQSTIHAIQSVLSKIEKCVHDDAGKIDSAVQKEALQKIAAAKSDTNPTRLAEAMDVLKKIGTTAKGAVDVAATYAPLLVELGKFIGLGS